jgi:YVTN family beta-propeller protein
MCVLIPKPASRSAVLLAFTPAVALPPAPELAAAPPTPDEPDELVAPEAPPAPTAPTAPPPEDALPLRLEVAPGDPLVEVDVCFADEPQAAEATTDKASAVSPRREDFTGPAYLAIRAPRVSSSRHARRKAHRAFRPLGGGPTSWLDPCMATPEAAPRIAAVRALRALRGGAWMVIGAAAACSPPPAPAVSTPPPSEPYAMQPGVAPLDSRAADRPRSAPAPEHPTPARALLALSKDAHTLSIVDPATLQVVTRVAVGPDPHEVVALADGKTAFVSNTGSGRFHQIDVIDLVGQRQLPSVDTGPLLGPHGLASMGNKVWFTAEGAKAIARLDPTTAKIDLVVGTGQDRTHMLFVTGDEKHVYTTNVESGTVSLLESVVRQPPPPPPSPPGTPLHGAPPFGQAPPGGGPQPRFDWAETVVPTGKGSEGFDVSPDGRELWTVAAQDGAIAIVDLTSGKLSASLPAGVVGANRLKITPDGSLALISSLRTGDLVVYDVRARKERKRIPIGHGGAGVLIEPDGARAFVACSPDDYVAVIDLKTLAVTGRVDVGGKPDGLAWAIRR